MIWDGWTSLNRFIVRDRFAYARLRLNLNIIPNSYMAHDAHLSSYFAVIADLGGPGNPGLCRDYSMSSDFYIVRNMNLVVKFDTLSDYCGSQGGPVYCSAGSYIYIIFDNDIACLRNFAVIPILVGCKTEPITTNNGSCMDGATTSNFRL